MPDDVRYRWIDGPTATDAEWSRIDEILATRGWSSLNRQTSRIRVAENAAGDLLGFVVLQLFPHAEPLWVRPSARGTGVAEQLADDIVGWLMEVGVRGFEVTADTEHAVRLAEKQGMKRVTIPVYRTVQ